MATPFFASGNIRFIRKTPYGYKLTLTNCTVVQVVHDKSIKELEAAMKEVDDMLKRKFFPSDQRCDVISEVLEEKYGW